MTATKGGFNAQVSAQRDELRDRLAALEYVADINAATEKQAAYGKDRERGGPVLDPVDPTRVVVPIVWLRALLAYSRVQGYGVIADSPEMATLLAEWNTNYHPSTGGTEFEPLERSHPDLARALAAFLATL